MPMTLSALALVRWEPSPANWVAGAIITLAGAIGLTLAYTIPRYREAPIART